MKLIRFGEKDHEKPGISLDGASFDVSGLVNDYNEAFFSGERIKELEKYSLKDLQGLPPVPGAARLGSPIARPSKIVCVGLNYADHAKETKAAIPTEPVLFLKATSALTGPFDNVTIPRNSQKTDWEVELAVVIGKKASYVDERHAMDHVFGYCLHNDISEREFQLEKGGTWDKGKGCDTFAPVGPWLVTKDEIGNVNNLRLWLRVNGKTMQDSNTSNFIFKIPFLVSYISRFMTLLPGDIISTGTPSGVGLGFTPPVYLKPGDIMELGIDGLGQSRQKCIAYAR